MSKGRPLTKETVQHAAVALGRMRDLRFLKPFVSLLAEEKEPLALETAQKLGLFPLVSRLKVFEAINQFFEDDEKTKNRILARLDKTNLDFTIEKEALNKAIEIPAEVGL